MVNDQCLWMRNTQTIIIYVAVSTPSSCILSLQKWLHLWLCYECGTITLATMFRKGIAIGVLLQLSSSVSSHAIFQKRHTQIPSKCDRHNNIWILTGHTGLKYIHEGTPTPCHIPISLPLPNTHSLFPDIQNCCTVMCHRKVCATHFISCMTTTNIIIMPSGIFAIITAIVKKKNSYSFTR